MTGKGSVRRLYPGGNTPKGFYSFYDYILRQSDATRIIVIKGGPGVGKSTIMKHIGETMAELGFDVEYHHCSADNSSVDGVVIPSIGVAMLDGTAPHVVDPKNPGAVDEILHLGDFWDEAGMRKNRDNILAVNREVGKNFRRAYRYLTAARSVYDDIESVNVEATDFGWLNQQAAGLVDELFGDRAVAAVPGKARHLFGSAITPDGPRNYLQTVIGPMGRKVVVTGKPGTGKATLVQKLATAAVERGLDVETFHCPFDPEKLEHLVIPGVDLAVTTSAEPHVWDGKADWVVDTSEALCDEVRQPYTDVITRAEEAYRQLFDTAVSYLSKAKALHDDMETYYVPNMHFDKLNALREKVLDRILGYAKEKALV